MVHDVCKKVLTVVGGCKTHSFNFLGELCFEPNWAQKLTNGPYI